MKILAIVTEAATARSCLDAAVVAAKVDKFARIEALHVVVDPDQLVSSTEEVQIQRLRETAEGTASDKAMAAQAAFVAWNAGTADDTPRVEWKAPAGAEEATPTSLCWCRAKISTAATRSTPRSARRASRSCWCRRIGRPDRPPSRTSPWR